MGLGGGLASNGQTGGQVPAGVVSASQLEPGNLGSAATVNFGSVPNKAVMLVGTLNANCVITLTNRAAGCTAILLLTQDGTGGRTLTISDGTNTQAVTIPTTASTSTVVTVNCPDSTNLYVVPPATAGPAGATGATGPTGPTGPTGATGAPGSGATIDTTASDIQPLGTRAAGATGLAADAGHVHAMPTPSQVGRAQQRNLALGFKDQAWDLFAAGVSGAAIVTQDAWFVLAGFLAGDVVTNIIACVTQAAAGTAPTGLYVGLYSAAGVQEGVSANLASSAIWTSTGFAIAPLATPFTIPTSGGYYLSILENGVFGTTPLQIASRALNGAEAKAIAGGVTFAGIQAAQTTPPSPATITGNASSNFWLGWN